MKIDKANKLKKQEKIFSIFSKIVFIIIGVLIIITMVSSLAMFTAILLRKIILPIILVLGIAVLLMYLEKVVTYKKQVSKMVLKVLGILIATVLLVCGGVWAFVYSITGIFYKLLLLLALISYFFLYAAISKQYKTIIKEQIQEIDTEGNIEAKVEEDKKSKKDLKIVIFTTIGIALSIILIAVIVNALENKKNLEKNQSANVVENSVEDTQDTTEYYTYFADDKNGTKVEIGYPFRDKCIIQIYKTEDGGETWNEIDTNLTQVYEGTKCLFINEKIGFLHDPHGGADSFASLSMTKDGGYTWEDVKVNKPKEITEKNIFFKDLPVQNGENLEVIAYTFDLGRNPEYKYFKFESSDLGKTWDFVEEIDA